MGNVRTVLDGVRTLLEDPDGQIFTDAFLLPKLNIAYNLAINKISRFSTPADTRYALIPGLPAGTTDLSPYQVQQKVGLQSGANYPLAGLITPLDIEWKQAGQPESNYIFMAEKGILPNITPGSYIIGQQSYWEWRSNHIYLTPFTLVVDLRVRGEFVPPVLLTQDDEIQIHTQLPVYLQFAVAALSGAAMLNMQQVQLFQPQSEDAMQDILSFFIRKDQSLPVRVGKITGGRRRYGRGGW